MKTLFYKIKLILAKGVTTIEKRNALESWLQYKANAIPNHFNSNSVPFLQYVKKNQFKGITGQGNKLLSTVAIPVQASDLQVEV